MASSNGKQGKKVQVNPLSGHPVLDLLNLVEGMSRYLGRSGFWAYIDTRRSEDASLPEDCYLTEDYIAEVIYPDCKARSERKNGMIAPSAVEKEARFLAHDFAQFACTLAHWRRYQTVYLFSPALAGKLDTAAYAGPDGRLFLDRHGLPFDAMYVTAPFRVSDEAYSGFFAFHQAGKPIDRAHPLTLIFTGADAGTTEYVSLWLRGGRYDYAQFMTCASVNSDFYGVEVKGDADSHTERSDAMFATVEHALRMLTYLAAANADIAPSKSDQVLRLRSSDYDEKRVRKNVRSPDSPSKLVKLHVGYGGGAGGARFTQFDGRLMWE